MTKFQIILLAVFGLFILIGVATFSLYRGGGSSNTPIVIWGDIPSNDFDFLLNSKILTEVKIASISYVQKSPAALESEFTEALARGAGPDLIILTQDQLIKNKPKLTLIPFANVSERSFQSAFVEESELFVEPDKGIYALPLTIDPLVLYYHRDLLSAAGVSQPMAYWDEIYSAALNLSKRDGAGNLVASVMALGEARNITHAKEIVSLLMLQAGTPITSLNDNGLRSEIFNNVGQAVLPAESALDFYTQFSNPTKVFYSWNRSLLDAQTH